MNKLECPFCNTTSMEYIFHIDMNNIPLTEEDHHWICLICKKIFPFNYFEDEINDNGSDIY